MSKFLFYATRPGATDLSGHDSQRFLKSSALLAPGLLPRDDDVVLRENAWSRLAVSSMVKSVRVRDTSVCLGFAVGGDDPWWQVGSSAPEGTYAIVRSDEERVELLTDVVGSRTVWYYADETQFLAATSQRAIVSMLGSLMFNEAVIPWILSSGGLGPYNSWDSRIQMVPPHGRVVLQRSNWAVSVASQQLEFTPTELDHSYHEQALNMAMSEIGDDLDIDPTEWVLPLSGGGDCRGILASLANSTRGATGLRTITWGLSQSQGRPGNDATIAREVAEHFGVTNTYFSLDSDPVAPETVIDRFLEAGEGRIDHIGGYTDGMQLWLALRELGYESVIRGDQAFGLPQVATERDARIKARLTLMGDVQNLHEFSVGDSLPPQVVPEQLSRLDNESLAMWRDRLSLTYRIPVVMSALTDVKTSYVELMNPLLFSRMIDTVLRMPDSLRTDKRLYKQLAAGFAPGIGFATEMAIPDSQHILADPEFEVLLRDTLHSHAAGMTLPAKLIQQIAKGLNGAHKPASSQNLRSFVKRLIPRSATSLVRDAVTLPRVAWHTLALRVLILLRMIQVLESDALGAGTQEL